MTVWGPVPSAAVMVALYGEGEGKMKSPPHTAGPSPSPCCGGGGEGNKEGPSAPDETLGQAPLQMRSPQSTKLVSTLDGAWQEDSSGSPQPWVPIPALPPPDWVTWGW